MLQITLDPNLVSYYRGDTPYPLQVVVSISGLSWKRNGDDNTLGENSFPADWQKENGRDAAKKYLYPWRWDSPSHIRIFWLIKEASHYESVFYTDLEVDNNSRLIDYNADAVTIKTYYEEILDKRIFRKEPPLIDGRVLFESIEQDKKQEILMDDSNSSIEPTTHFYNTSIANFSQNIPPLNALAKLVFFGEDSLFSPNGLEEKNIEGFTAFPINKTEGKRWYTETDRVISSHFDKNKNKFAQFKIQYNFDGNEIAVFSPFNTLPRISELPITDTNHSIRIRDENWNFLGHVDLQVNDIENQVPSILYAASSAFDLPVGLLKYLKSKFPDGTPIDFGDQSIFDQLNKILCASLRDSLGFGFLPESDGNSLVIRIVRAYCDLNKSSQTSTTEDQITYWKKFYDIKEKLLDTVISKNKEFKNIDEWINLLKTTIKKHENSIRDIENVTPLEDNVFQLIESVFSKNYSDFHEWSEDWSNLLSEVLKNSLLQWRIVFAQWNTINLKDAGIDTTKLPGNENEFINKLKWFEKIFSGAGELRSLHKEAIAVLNETVNSPDSITNFLNKEILVKTTDEPDDYLSRISHVVAGQTKSFYAQREKNKFSELLPQVDFDFSSTSDGTEVSWNEFLDSITDIPEDTKKALQKELEITFPSPPNVQIKVDSLQTQSKAFIDGDLNDEIAGHIILMRRENKKLEEADKFKDVAWRYLNFAKVEVESMINKTEITTEKTFSINKTIQPLVNSYISPVFIPESEGNKNAFLTLSNEKLSLVSGHDNNEEYVKLNSTETGQNSFAEVYDAIWYNDISVGPKPLKYLFDEDQSAYALWYGYKYEFSGFVALNSGVLPDLLREDKGTWNKPKKELITSSIPRIIYPHRRRVPVSKVRVEVKASDGKSAVLPVPKGLHPLAFEIPGWIKEEDNINSYPMKDIAHYLMGAGDNFDQKKIVLTIKKPTTPFWNWYAWHGNEVQREVQEAALTRELNIRQAATENNTDVGEHLLEPAINKEFLVSIETIFPSKSDDTKWQKIPWNPDDNGLIDVNYDVSVRLSTKDDTHYGWILDHQQLPKDLIVAPGEIIKVKIHGLIKRSYVKGNDRKFHSWMDNVIDSKVKPPDDLQVTDYYLTHPQEIWFEAAIPSSELKLEEIIVLEKNKKRQNILNERLWETLKIKEQENDKVQLEVGKTSWDDYSEYFAYTSRTEIHHQVWHWNGRLDESESIVDSIPGDQITTAKEDINDKLDPVDKKTTKAMKWEAWAFSDRPDFSALVQETNLLAYRFNGDTVQTLFTDHRPSEKKALYYRFSATLHARYELLGKDYRFSIESKQPLEDPNKHDKWKRYVRKYDVKTGARLPRPSIRFVIPLTKSIKECRDTDTISGASLLVVLDDRWFTEAGLAEQFELGIEVVKNPHSESEKYLSAGNDPILTGTSLTPLKTDRDGEKGSGGNKKYPYREENNDQDVLVFDAKGPAGLTFDFAAKTPRLKGCAFVVEIPNLEEILEQPSKDNDQEKTNILKAWSMVQIAVRRRLRPAFCENTENPEALTSEWTAKEWVQFLPSVDSFIPQTWKKAVTLKYGVEIKIEPDPKESNPEKKWNGKTISVKYGNSLPKFDAIFDDLNDRFIILTERVYDIGGQPTERYLATYRYCEQGLGKEPIFEINTPEKLEGDSRKIEEGYLRIMVVRKPNKGDHSSEPIWKRLFGDNATDRPDLSKIQSDPTAALPLVSERVPFKNTLTKKS
jgi:hypothetical protein